MTCSKIRASEAKQGRFGGKEWLTECLPSGTTTRARERERESINKMKEKNKVKVKYIYILMV
jgi:hypothetical protein